MPLKNSAGKGTKNRVNGSFDYRLPTPWVGNPPPDGSETSDRGATISNAVLQQLAASGAGLPIDIYNSGSPDDPPEVVNPSVNDDTGEVGDGLAYDVLFWDLDSSANVGFTQPFYAFQEGVPVPTIGNKPAVRKTVGLVSGGPIRSTVILIQDYTYPAVKTGTVGADFLIGSEKSDGIYGNAGNDVIDGLENPDSLVGGDGDDFVNGGSSGDVVVGGTGNDRLYGEAGADELAGLDGQDTLYGGSGSDLLYGDGGTDVLYGGTGNDILTGGAGQDSLVGGTGADRFVFASSLSSYSPSIDGIDIISDFNRLQEDELAVASSSFSFTTVSGRLSPEQFTVGTAATTASHRFIYNATTGALFFDSDGAGGSSQQQIAILTGTPTVTYSDIILEDPTTKPGSTADTTLLNGRSITGTTATDRLVGDEGADTLNGSAGDDWVAGLEGNDALFGGEGKDQLSGGSGNDAISGENGSDQLYGEAGNDALNGGSGNDTFRGGSGNDVLTGGSGRDRFNFYHSALDGSDVITDLNPSEDQIGIYVGNYSVQSAYRRAGLATNSPITADQFQVGTQAVDSSDRFIYNRSTGALLFDVDGTGATLPVQVAALSPNLSLTSANIIAFDDTNSTAPPEPANQRGTQGKDRLIGDERNNQLVGLGGNDSLSGAAGNDSLDGGKGNDRLQGGLGSDKLKGGAGRDLFVLEKGIGRDTIQDFRDRSDRFGLADGLKFRRLKITQRGRNTLISIGTDPLALVTGVQANQLTAVDFRSI